MMIRHRWITKKIQRTELFDRKYRSTLEWKQDINNWFGWERVRVPSQSKQRLKRKRGEECLPTHTNEINLCPFLLLRFLIYLFVIWEPKFVMYTEIYSLHERLCFVLLHFFSCQKFCTFSFHRQMNFFNN
jgi:hypothetical protein